MKKRGNPILSIMLGLLFILTLYLAFWPVAIKPVAWDTPKSEGYQGPFKKNNKLAELSFIDIGDYAEPEYMVYQSDWLYAAMKGGEIIRMRHDGSEMEEVITTKGRPLGFDFDSEGAIIVADPMYGDHGGLLRVINHENEAKIELLTDSVDDSPIQFADAVAVAQNGKIYFTDASQKVNVNKIGDVGKAGEIDILANSSSGRLLEFDPATKETRVLIKDLSFANGITLSKDKQHIFLNETGKYRIWKVDVEARNLSANEQQNGAHVLIENLPGLPDNMTRGQDGRIWIGLVNPRNAFLDLSADKPWMRAVAMRLPHFLLPKGAGYMHVIAIDESGKILTDLQDSNGVYPNITGVTETDDQLYFHHLNETKSIGWVRKTEVGL
ncbi:MULTISPECIES: SMP-30/gluconolactonase/LRE family protein [unclassified Bacillus (in: firmicutes)]|uniref:SMP-30/gluconolactonase/LRE family protein n=1 Tax=unclassified Bacillus (in: firmicutes) TaxID=185979 RepID=UPI0008E2211B|nr:MULTISPECIES: SMP-30/gluconolactonase/LRE family protein [unclassified Bacillus (in: firmicutes)]SFA86165.1 Sugar lactone lactonase YvrE [Bacillus sp. UNCCL13]SFQ83601.1 Sugar lactone lactonase YvrE [Bacillus sp. cl95]